MYRLVYLRGRQKGRRLLIRGGRVLIGSSAKCGIAISDDAVEPEHALIEQRERDVFVRSVSQAGELYLNGQTISDAILHDGDKIGIGPEQFRFIAPKSSSGLTSRRRRHSLQTITLVVVAILLLIEILIILGWSVYIEQTKRVARENTETRPAVESGGEPTSPPTTPPSE